jgi:hypothetical protein
MIGKEIAKRSIKKLTLWCSNNWRMRHGVARKSNNFRPKRTDIIWQMRQQDVMVEVAKILKLDEATTRTPGWFSARTPAMKNIIDRMTQEELRELDLEVEDMTKKGYDEEVQKR